MTEQIKFSRCECLYCKGGIEFEISGFRERIRTNLLIYGQEIKCPHCGRLTLIYQDNKLIKNSPLPLFQKQD